MNMFSSEEIAHQIIDSAIKVHKAFGPGLLESAYQAALAYELRQRGIRVACEVAQPLMYYGVEIDAGYRLDMVIEEKVIIENKAIDQLLPIHKAQLITYLKLSGLSLGFLINWNVMLIKDGIVRVVYQYQEESNRQESNR